MNRSDWDALRFGVNAERSGNATELNHRRPFVGGIDGKCNRQIVRPTPVDPLPKSLGGNPGASGPIEKSFGLPTMGDEDVVCLVASLLYGGGPAAIIGAVRPVVVDAVNAEPGEVLPVIVEDEQAHISPSVADKDSSPPIPRVGTILGVLTPSHHGFPYAEQRVPGEAVRALPGAAEFAPEAPARRRGSAHQSALSSRLRFSAAVALGREKVCSTRSALTTDSGDNQAPEALTNHVFHGGKHITVDCETKERVD